MSRVRYTVRLQVLGRPVEAIIDNAIPETIIRDDWIDRLRDQDGVRFLPMRLMLALIGRVFPVSALALIKFTFRDGAIEIIRYHPVVFLPHPPAEIILGITMLRLWSAGITENPLILWIRDDSGYQLGLPVERLSSSDDSSSDTE